jgi:hypothetical protein
MLRPGVQRGRLFGANRRPVEADSALPEREDRRPISLPAFANLPDRSTVSLTVVDLSYDGCKVETPMALMPGTCITLSVSQLGVLNANVRWYDNGHAGLCFSSELEKSPPQQPRKDDRVSLKASVSLRRQGSVNYLVTTTDVSPSGCRVDFVERPTAGEIHWIKFEGLEALEVQVRWVRGFSAGVQFTRAIHPAVFEMLVTKLK